MAQDISSNATPASDPVRSDSLTTPTLGQRIAVTLAVLAVAKFGEFVPIPGLDSEIWNELSKHSTSSLIPSRISAFALGVIPIFSSLVLAEMLMLVFPPLRRKWSNPASHRTFERGVLIAALTLAAFQAWGIALAMEAITGLVAEPGWAFRAFAAVSMIAATAVLSWLANIITRYGIGSGFWVLFTAAQLPGAVIAASHLFELARSGAVSAEMLPLPLIFIAASTWALVALERTNPGLARDGAYIWPPILAGVTAGWILLELFVLNGSSETDAGNELMKPGSLAHVLTLVSLVPLFTFWRLRSLKANDPNSATASTPILIAIVLTAVAIAGEVLAAYLPIPGLPTGELIIITISIALSMLGGLRRPGVAGVVS